MYTSHTAVRGSSGLSTFLLSLITLDERNVSDRFGRMAPGAYGSDPDETEGDEVADEDEVVPGGDLGEDEEEGGDEMGMGEDDNPEEGEEEEDEKKDPLADDF